MAIFSLLLECLLWSVFVFFVTQEVKTVGVLEEFRKETQIENYSMLCGRLLVAKKNLAAAYQFVNEKMPKNISYYQEKINYLEVTKQIDLVMEKLERRNGSCDKFKSFLIFKNQNQFETAKIPNYIVYYNGV